MALSVKVREALAAPVADGLNVTDTTQLAPGASTSPPAQVVEAATMVNAAAFVPLRPGFASPLLVKVSDAVPVFVRRTVAASPVPPTGTEPNWSMATDRLAPAETDICDVLRFGALLHPAANEQSAATTSVIEVLLIFLISELRSSKDSPSVLPIPRPAEVEERGLPSCKALAASRRNTRCRGFPNLDPAIPHGSFLEEK